MGPHSRVWCWRVQPGATHHLGESRERCTVRAESDIATVAAHYRPRWRVHRDGRVHAVPHAHLPSGSDDSATFAEVHGQHASHGTNHNRGARAAAHEHVAERSEQVQERLATSLNQKVVQARGTSSRHRGCSKCRSRVASGGRQWGRSMNDGPSHHAQGTQRRTARWWKLWSSGG